MFIWSSLQGDKCTGFVKEVGREFYLFEITFLCIVPVHCMMLPRSSLVVTPTELYAAIPGYQGNYYSAAYVIEYFCVSGRKNLGV